MGNRILKSVFLFLSLSVTLISGEFNLYKCYGSDCPTFSLPENLKEEEPSAFECNGTELVVKDPKDCHQFYYCRPNDNTTATHYKCPQGYAFKEDWMYCVPEHFVKNCSAIYCPPFIYDGVIPDPKDCSAFYRCMYGFPSKYKCPKGSIFDEESGQCKVYQEQPDCLKKDHVTTTMPTTTVSNELVNATTTAATTNTTTESLTKPEHH